MKLQDPAAFKREREVIERQTGHLAALLDDLSDVSRFTRGRVELQREPLEVREVIDNAIETAGPLLARYQHRVEVKVPDRGMAVDADRTRLRQVFSNLITNAAKYAAPHGRIQIEAERTRDRVVVTVRDDGPGIPDDVAAHIFEPFVQGQRSLGQSLGGLGLGLAIVHNLVTLHGGTVSARTPASGKGTEFVVSLPGQLRPSGVVPRNPVAGRRVLVMDADGDAAAWMARLLEAMGHTTALASDAAAAIERAYDFHPDLAILAVDQGAVDGAGLTLAGRFRGDARLRGVHLVAMIAAGDGARVSFADFDAELSKPVDVTRLASILRSDPGGSSVSADGATRR
jgi:CheY-like chemotaxis protein